MKKPAGPIVQPPNAPIIVALIAALISLLWPASFIGELARSVTAAALTLWAFLEVFEGDSRFRRVLGLAVLLIVMLSVVTWVGSGS